MKERLIRLRAPVGARAGARGSALERTRRVDIDRHCRRRAPAPLRGPLVVRLRRRAAAPAGAPSHRLRLRMRAVSPAVSAVRRRRGRRNRARGAARVTALPAHTRLWRLVGEARGEAPQPWRGLVIKGVALGALGALAHSSTRCTAARCRVRRRRANRRRLRRRWRRLERVVGRWATRTVRPICAASDMAARISPSVGELAARWARRRAWCKAWRVWIAEAAIVWTCADAERLAQRRALCCPRAT